MNKTLNVHYFCCSARSQARDFMLHLLTDARFKNVG